MRTAVFAAMLGTLMCFASAEEEASLSSDLLSSVWQEAHKIYKRSVVDSFVNGSSATRSRRGAQNTPFSDQYTEAANTYPIYEEMLEKRHGISKRQAAGQQNPTMCTNPSTTQCSSFINSRYRTVDGTCNNPNNPAWGAVNRPLARLLAPAYDDNVNVPRGGFATRLPNPRVVSTTVHPDSSVVNRQVTNMVPQFGQFLDHDITSTPQANSMCCSNPSSNVDCWSIPISTGDSFYSRFSQTCMDFTRSTACSQSGVRQQMNSNTAWIDGSQIYGSTSQRSNQLRTFSGGQLRTHPSLTGFLPLATSIGVQVQGNFVAGDDRINEMPALAVMHNVFIMEHNRIARNFQNRGWSDEQIYQETRRLVVAELQNIVYNEYLPIVLGPSAMQEYGLSLGTTTTYSQYNSNVDGTIINSFATAAYRFGHSMIAGIVRLISGTNQVVGSYNIADQYFQSGQVTQANGQGYDLILRGLMTQNAPEMDRFVTTGVTNNLFKAQGASFGGDLVARNIQRGRDHGLRSYNDFRVACGGSDLSKSGSALPANVSPDGWSSVGQLYRSPLDIDLFVGGLIETPVPNGISGPTFTCIKATQFARLKFGDRYFFTHNLNIGFNSQQLNEIRTRRMSDIICQNSQQPDAPANAFLVPSSNNPSISCSDPSRNRLNQNLF